MAKTNSFYLIYYNSLILKIWLLSELFSSIVLVKFVERFILRRRSFSFRHRLAPISLFFMLRGSDILNVLVGFDEKFQNITLRKLFNFYKNKAKLTTFHVHMCLNLLNTRITIANFHFNYKMNLENITIKQNTELK